MSVERVTYLILTCDRCGDIFQPVESTVSAARREARVEGWKRTRAVSEDDLCRECARAAQ